MRPQIQIQRVLVEGGGSQHAGYSPQEDAMEEEDEGAEADANQNGRPHNGQIQLSLTSGAAQARDAVGEVDLDPRSGGVAGSGDVAGSGSGRRLTALRARLLKLLQLHCQHSQRLPATQSPSTTAQGVPQWALVCSPRELPALCAKYAGLAEQQLQQPGSSTSTRIDGEEEDGDVGMATGADGGGGDVRDGSSGSAGGGAAARLQLQHEAESWRLVSCLFGFIEGERLPVQENSNGQDGGRNGRDGDDAMTDVGYSDYGNGSGSIGEGDVDMDGVEGGVRGGHAGRGSVAGAVEGEETFVLAAFARKAGVSRWLMRQAKVSPSAGMGRERARSNAICNGVNHNCD